MNHAIQLGCRRWNLWRDRSVNRRVFAAIVTVGGLTVLVKLAAAAKELAVAYRFGTSDALDAFLIAFMVPQFVVELIGGSFNSALIPTYIQVREQEGQQAAQRLLSSVMASSLVSLLGLLVLLAFLARYLLPVVASGFSPDKLALTERLYYALLPILLFSGLTVTWSAILNAGERFALGAITPMITPLLVVIILLGIGDNLGIYWLAGGTVVGLILEAVVVGWWLTSQGVSLVPRWYGSSPAVKQVFQQYTPAVAAAFLMGSTWVIAQSMAAGLGPGSVSILAYGSKATLLLLGVGSVAVSTAVLPHFSRMVALHDVQGVRHTMKTYASLTLMITIPLIMILTYYSEPLIRLLLQRGAFTAADTSMVGQVQAIYLLQVPLYVVGIICVRVIIAFKANHLLLWGTAMNLCLAVVLSYMLMHWLQVVGIALSITLMYWFSAGYLALSARRLVGRAVRS